MDLKISALPAVTTLSTTDLVPVVKGGVTSKITFANFQASLYYNTIEDEGANLTQRAVLNFVGAGVTVTDTGGKTTVTIAGGGGTHDILSATHTDTLVAAVTRGAIIVGNSTPQWARVTIGASGTFVQSDGTDTKFSTIALPLTTTINRILFSSAANTIGEIGAAVDSVLVSGATGIPGMSTDLPGTVTIGTGYIYRVGGNDVAIADGGTGQSTAILGFNALSPVTTRGDIIVRGVTDNVRLALGTVGKILRSDGTDLVYTTLTMPDSITVNQILFAGSTNVLGGSAQLTFASATSSLTNALSTNAGISTTTSNANAGGAAAAHTDSSNATNTIRLSMLGTAFTTAGLLVANLGRLSTTSAAGILITASNAAGVVAFSIAGTAATNESARVDANGVHFFQPLKGISYKVQTDGLVGRTTLVLGTKAITITGLTTSHKGFVSLQAIGGTIAAQYRVVCTANTLTIDAITAGGIVQTLDTSTLEYWCILTN